MFRTGVRGLGLAVLLLLGGCGADQPPANAVRVDRDLYMVPGKCDRHGYREFHPWSRSGTVMPIIYYRKRGGGFTYDSSEAVPGCQGP